VFGCDEKTIWKGIKELANEECMNQATIRRSGGVCPSAISNNPGNVRNIFGSFTRTYRFRSHG